MNREELTKDMSIKLEGGGKKKVGVVASVTETSFCVVWNDAEIIEGNSVKSFYMIERDLPYFDKGPPLN